MTNGSISAIQSLTTTFVSAQDDTAENFFGVQENTVSNNKYVLVMIQIVIYTFAMVYFISF